MADYQEHIDAFDGAGIAVVAASAEGAAETGELIATLGLTYPLLCGVDARQVSESYGAFTSDRGFVHATGFIVRPDGTVELAVYSTGSRGRLTARDALELIAARTR